MREADTGTTPPVARTALADNSRHPTPSSPGTPCITVMCASASGNTNETFAKVTAPIAGKLARIILNRTRRTAAENALSSPLQADALVDAVNSGKPVRPSLIASTPLSEGGSVPSGIPARMSALMTTAVQLPGGTGRYLAEFRGVAGETGTAEFGTNAQIRDHDWFAGMQRKFAFAMLVYNRAAQHVKAAEVTRHFLQNLSQR